MRKFASGMPEANNDNAQNAATNDTEAGAGTSTNNAPPPAASTNEASGETRTYTQADFDAEVDKRIQSALKAERARVTRESEKQQDDAQLPELERVKKQLSETQAQLRERAATDSIVEAAQSVGAKNPGNIAKLMRAQIEFDEAGQPVNVTEVVAAFKRDYPELFGENKSGAQQAATSIDAGARNGGAGGTGKTVYRQSQLNDRAFYERNRDDILAAMREGRILIED